MKRCEHFAQEIALESELSKTIFVQKVYADMVGMTFCPSNHKIKKYVAVITKETQDERPVVG